MEKNPSRLGASCRRRPTQRSNMPDQPEPTIADLVRMYFQLGMDDLAAHNKENKLRILKLFAAEFRTKCTADLKAIEITKWLAGHSTWKSPWTYNHAIAVIRRLFNWSME